jgi:nitrite reductase/ring-hydroxylating ferredoxin subunit
VRACAASDVRRGEPKGLSLRGIPIALYSLDEGIFATHDECTHAYALLSDGYLEDAVVECPLHGAMYDVRTGKCLAVADCDVRTYKVKLEDGQVLVELPQ